MLSSSGCFRRFPCPFLSRCHRVYCHFEHAGRLPTSQDASANILGNYHDQPVSATTACTVLELEKVTKAIELIRTEVEEQQHELLMFHSSCDGGSHSLISPINSQANSFSCTGTTSIKYKPFSFYECNYAVYNPQPIYNCSACKCTFKVSGEDASQDLALANSNDKTDGSLWSQNLVECCKPSSDVEYDPLVNFFTLEDKSCNEDLEEKLECKGAIEPSSEMKHSLVSETVRNSQPFEAEMSSEDELVIDVPDLPLLTPCSKNHGEFQRKGSDDPALICEKMIAGNWSQMSRNVEKPKKKVQCV
ncbi:RNA exonuclease 1 homolog [Mobula hypostoma]|uniref:RNA exonuclease 1 homolog n=1 Tax=Mobula hypostoma TaxID=723540 RepID=UPI002FC33465